MTKTERNARFDHFCSNDDNFVAVAYNSSEAIALRADQSRKSLAKAKRLAPVKAAEASRVASLQIGQRVKLVNKPAWGLVTAVSEKAITVNVTEIAMGMTKLLGERAYGASFIQAA